MTVDSELLTAAIGAAAGALGGAGLSIGILKKQLKAVSGNVSLSEILNIIGNLVKAVDENSPGGPTITAAEAEALGRAVWEAFKSK